MNASSSEPIPDLRWLLRYSAIAYLLIVLWQCGGVLFAVPNFPPLYQGFGADLPAITVFVIRFYWLGCALVVALSILSTVVLVLRPNAPASQLKTGYITSLSALVGAFAWAGFVTAAIYAPIFKLGAVV